MSGAKEELGWIALRFLRAAGSQIGAGGCGISVSANRVYEHDV